VPVMVRTILPPTVTTPPETFMVAVAVPAEPLWEERVILPEPLDAPQGSGLPGSS
jgi:hypothetical protein